MKIKTDSLLHAGACFVITTAATVIFHLFGFVYAGLLGVGVAWAVAVGKEVYDYFTPNHSCEASDLLWDIIGSLSALAMCLLLMT